MGPPGRPRRGLKGTPPPAIFVHVELKMGTPQQHIVETLREVAEFFDVDRGTVYAWRDSGMPGKPGKWDVAKITRWLFTAGPWRSGQSRDDILRGAWD